MSLTIVHDRLKRLVDSGMREPCTTVERLTHLRELLSGLDNKILADMESMFIGLGDRTRLQILKLITEEELCVCEISAALELTQPTTSHHLRILERGGLVSSRHRGRWVFYRLANSSVKKMFEDALKIVKEGM
ncbi:winged helix-turn-helix transcriptional regulator [Candidatus Bathyarchaeota archaeon]|nr:winged helix-turn-helix transcriptional regulator [Candidatus Bathyarchaeota archaeon]